LNSWNSGHNRFNRRHFAIFGRLPPQNCRRSLRNLGALRVIRPRLEGFPAMTRSPGAAGFNSRSAPVASSRLIDAVAASLAIGSLSLCLIVALTVLSIKVSVAMPIPV
jgi:hypothetical protein